MKTVLKIVGIILLVGGLIGSALALNSLYTPSFEQQSYEKASRMAELKVQAAKDAQGKRDEAEKADDAKSAVRIAETWRDGMEKRQSNYKFGVIVSGAIALVGALILLSSFFVRGKVTP